MKNKFKVCFLDRDGIINIDKGHITKIKQIFIYPKIFKLIRLLKKNNYIIAVVTNQSVIGRKLLTINELNNLHNFINKKLEKKNCKIDYFYFCPHHPKYGKEKYKTICDCRKPNPGMINKFKSNFKIDIQRSIMIGDKFSDYMAAKRSKIKFFFGLRDLLVKDLKNFINKKN
jgi:D-glycero-D-manno-heptose 1,7-bisphosphate phosphatase